MDDLSAKLNEILADPQSMQQIQGLLQGLGGGSAAPAAPQSAAQNALPPPQPAAAPAAGGVDLSMLSNLLGSFSQQPAAPAVAPAPGGESTEMIASIARIMPLLQQVQTDDDTSRLLQALRPLLSESRRARLDQSMKLLKFMRLMPLLKGSGFLSNLL